MAYPDTVATFAGMVDVPLFDGPDLNIGSYVGYPASPKFSSSSDVPLFSYQPQTPATNAEELGRLCAVIPTLDGQSELLLNPEQVAGLSGMLFNATHIKGFTYCLGEYASGPFITWYNWMLYVMAQGRAAGQTLASPSRRRITPINPPVATANIRREFSLGVMPGRDGFGTGYPAVSLYNWGNVYNRVYGVIFLQSGQMYLRNAFFTADLGLIWPQFIQGSATAQMTTDHINGNHLFVSKGLKDSAYILDYSLTQYDPDTIFGCEPGQRRVSFADPIYQAAFDGVQNVTTYRNGFVFILNTEGLGVTGQNQEAVVVDWQFRTYKVLRFVPQTSSAVQAMIPDNTIWSVKIDNEGTVWFYNGGSAGFKNKVYNSWSPALFFNPRLIDLELPAVTMPCYNTCMPGYF